MSNHLKFSFEPAAVSEPNFSEAYASLLEYASKMGMEKEVTAIWQRVATIPSPDQNSLIYQFSQVMGLLDPEISQKFAIACAAYHGVTNQALEISSGAFAPESAKSFQLGCVAAALQMKCAA